MSSLTNARCASWAASLTLLAALHSVAPVLASAEARTASHAARELRFDGPFRRIHHPSAYPRVAELSDGRLLCGIEQVLPDGRALAVVESRDSGRTWDGLTRIVEDGGRVDLANAFPLQLANGEVVVAYRHHSLDDGVFRLRLAASPDGRKGWTVRSTIAEGRAGVWEPFLLQLPDGRLQAYYASEIGVAPDQQVEVVTSKDNGATWSTPALVARRPRSRDGMPAVVPFGPDDLLAVFEAQDVAGSRFAIRAVRSSDGGATWSKERELVYRPVNRTGSGWAAGAPSVVRLGDGTLLVSFQTDEDVLFQHGDADRDPRHREYDYLRHCSLKYVSSGDAGRSWSEAMLLDGGPERTTVWNALHVLADGTLLVLSGSQDSVWCRRATVR